MHTTWQVQEAKNRFSEMIERAQSEGPQTITRHGRAVAQVVAAGAASSTTSSATSSDGFAAYLLAMPAVDGLPLAQKRSRKAPIQLGG